MSRAARSVLIGVALAFVSSTVFAQVVLRVRGTITGIEGDVLSVKTREGRDLRIRMSEKLVVVAAKAIRLEDLKPGEYAGATTRTRGDGALVALEVHTLPATARQGHFGWDLEPASMMTNGAVGTVGKATGGQELVIQYKEGSQKIIVPPGTPIVTTVDADRSALKTGEYIFTQAAVAADGTTTTQRITVSKDGVKPPQ
jgi:hypothetical protein